MASTPSFCLLQSSQTSALERSGVPTRHCTSLTVSGPCRSCASHGSHPRSCAMIPGHVSSPDRHDRVHQLAARISCARSVMRGLCCCPWNRSVGSLSKTHSRLRCHCHLRLRLQTGDGSAAFQRRRKVEHTGLVSNSQMRVSHASRSPRGSIHAAMRPLV